MQGQRAIRRPEIMQLTQSLAFCPSLATPTEAAPFNCNRLITHRSTSDTSVLPINGVPRQPCSFLERAAYFDLLWTITTCSNCKRKMLSLVAVGRSVVGLAALVPLTEPISDLSSVFISPTLHFIMRRTEAILATNSSESESELDVAQHELEVSKIIEPNLPLLAETTPLLLPPRLLALPLPLLLFPFGSLLSLSLSLPPPHPN